MSNYLPLVYWDLLLAGIPNLWCVSALLDLLPSSLRSLVYTCQYSSVKKGSKCASAIITYFPSAVFCRQNANYLSTTILCQLEVSSWLSRFTTTRVTITTWKIEGDISPHRNYTNFRKTIRDIPLQFLIGFVTLFEFMFTMLRLSTVCCTTAKRTYAAYGFYIHFFRVVVRQYATFHAISLSPKVLWLHYDSS